MELELDKILNPNSIWDLGNAWLYKLFETYPSNQNPEEIVAKVWILGRCYAAAVERRKSDDKLTNDEFYKTKVVHAIQSVQLDQLIAKIKSEHDEVIQIKIKLESHKILQDKLKVITGHDKRSFSSKFLHFHLPDAFYIYDTRAVNGLKLLPDNLKIKNKALKLKLGNNNFDIAYARFFFKCAYARAKISENLNRKISIREFDTILLDMVNQKSARKKI